MHKSISSNVSNFLWAGARIGFLRSFFGDPMGGKPKRLDITAVATSRAAGSCDMSFFPIVSIDIFERPLVCFGPGPDHLITEGLPLLPENPRP
jgi:hypothetical protein